MLEIKRLLSTFLIMNNQTLQIQYNKIHSYFKNTTEQYDYLEWDGTVLKVWDNDSVVEIYEYKDIINLIKK